MGVEGSPTYFLYALRGRKWRSYTPVVDFIVQSNGSGRWSR